MDSPQWTESAMRHGSVRDAILEHFKQNPGEASVDEIYTSVCEKLGPTARSSVRSYLGLNTGIWFERMSPGRYRLKKVKGSR
ncbi:hypothetical protein [Microvirga yunnanensis]|uniref:hypothetical protein n=1 Tax=Microvirga yunnanensis TaxID=2953740 RepID=UPI0021C5F1EF|nr:hypothetical protein [Microvirga sp. HBU67655]